MKDSLNSKEVKVFFLIVLRKNFRLLTKIALLQSDWWIPLPPISLERINQCHKMFCIEIVAKRRECLRLFLLVGCGQMCPENEIVQIKSTFSHFYTQKSIFIHCFTSFEEQTFAKICQLFSQKKLHHRCSTGI